MRLFSVFTVLAVLATASPLDVGVSARNNGKDNDKRNGKQCVVESSNGGDDSPAIYAAAKECVKDSTIVFKAGVDYNLLTPANMTGLSNVKIQLDGNLHLPKNMSTVLETVAATPQDMISGIWWLDIQGDKVHWNATSSSKGGWIYGYGQQYWDANPVNGTGIENRPKLVMWNITNSVIDYLKVSKPPAWGNSLRGNHIKINHVFFDATTRTGGGFPFNTDGFDITANNVVITDGVVLNGDDAIAINNGARNVTVQNFLISGPGCHGMSIGSLGRNNSEVQDVSGIHFKDVTAVGALYAARFKSYAGGQGLARDISWENFKIYNVTFPIYVTQTYNNQGNSQTQNGAEDTSGGNSSVRMEDFTWKNWRGTINSYHPGDASCASDPCWYAEDGADGTQVAIIRCASEDSCTGYHMEDIDVVPDNDAEPSLICANVAASTNPDFGLTCQDGSFTMSS